MTLIASGSELQMMLDASDALDHWSAALKLAVVAVLAVQLDVVAMLQEHRHQSRPSRAAEPSMHVGAALGRPPETPPGAGPPGSLAPDGSPGPSKCELQLLLIDLGTLVPILPRAALQPAMPCVGRYAIGVLSDPVRGGGCRYTR